MAKRSGGGPKNQHRQTPLGDVAAGGGGGGTASRRGAESSSRGSAAASPQRFNHRGRLRHGEAPSQPRRSGSSMLEDSAHTRRGRGIAMQPRRLHHVGWPFPPQPGPPQPPPLQSGRASAAVTRHPPPRRGDGWGGHGLASGRCGCERAARRSRMRGAMRAGVPWRATHGIHRATQAGHP